MHGVWNLHTPEAAESTRTDAPRENITAERTKFGSQRTGGGGMETDEQTIKHTLEHTGTI